MAGLLRGCLPRNGTGSRGVETAGWQVLARHAAFAERPRFAEAAAARGCRGRSAISRGFSSRKVKQNHPLSMF
eukprot:3710337-Rhodomonas_salina.1